MKTNRTLQKLRANEPVLIGNASPWVSAKVTELLGMLGFDGVWIDYEHHDMTDHDIFHACLGARASDCTPLVRVRGREYTSFLRPLELGAQGLIVPHIKDREEAEWAVRNTRFFPDGLRGLDGVEVNAEYGLQDTAEYMHQSNQETCLIIQIEDKEALENLDEIVSCPGVDGFFIGPADLTQSLGIPLQFDHPKLAAAFEAVSAAASRHGKWWGGPVSDAASFSKLYQQGARFFAWGSVAGCLLDGFQQVQQSFIKTVTNQQGMK